MQRDELSLREVSALYDIRDAGSVARWARLYDEGGINALTPRPRGRPRKMVTSLPPKPTEAGTPDERSREELLKENEYLRAEVAYLKKLDALLAKKQAAQKKKRK
jgi:transposase